MVDWDLVDKRRSKGWDWDRIASDPKVGYHAEESAGDPGRALRTLYYQRRSKAKRVSGDPSEGGSGSGSNGGPKPYSPLATVGFLLAPFFGIWFLLALVIPSPVGAFLPAIPWVGLLLAIGALLLLFGLLRSSERWNRVLRSAVVVGVVLGFAVSGSLALYAVSQGCPTLTSATTAEPNNWQKAANPAWTSNGAPVFFYYGSVACPYCSASSWAMFGALQAVGSLSGWSYGHSDSNPNDIPNTPEVVLASASFSSQYLALHVAESTNDNAITTPSTPSCIDSAYLSAYDSTGSIPFVVVGGTYIHVGTLVDPGQLRSTPGDTTSAPLSPQQVAGQMANQSGPAWNAISPQMYLLEAIFVKLNAAPPSVAANSNVQNWLSQLS